MNLTFKKISIKNFLSFGNVPEEIDLIKSPYRIIVGQNKDKSDSQDDANGVGKSSIYQSIHYAIFGKSIGNKVTLPSLVNNVNKKNMLVTLEFSVDDVNYTIERGRNPVVLKLYKENVEITDESLGDSRDTQSEIERIIGITSDVFSQIVCLSSGVPVFLEQPIGTQKEIIEKILGIDIISKKIASLKSLITETKNNINNEQFKYDTLVQQKQKTLNNIEYQLSELDRNKKNYELNKENKISELRKKISEIEKIDFEKEEKNLNDIQEYEKTYSENQKNKSLLKQKESELKDVETRILNNATKLDNLQKIDFQSERESFKYNDELKENKIKYDSELSLYKINKDKLMKSNNTFYDLSERIKKKESELNSIKDGICPLCGNIIDKEHTDEHRNKINAEIAELKEKQHQCDLEIMELNHLVANFKELSFDFKTTHFKTYEELLSAETEIKVLINMLTSLDKEHNELENEIFKIVIKDLGQKPLSKYNSMTELLTEKVSLETNKKQLEEFLNEKNPFDGQEETILKMKESIIEPNDTELNNCKDNLAHQELLHKLLSSPSSFIRKNILDKSLEFLNAKIKYYLIKLGSLHSVELNNDMSITITSMGLEYNYVSTGELSRISLALNFAFRDVWEALNNCKINIFLIDEILDKSGLDTSGKKDIVNCLTSIKDRNLLVVSHDEIVKSSTMDIITIVKEQGFSHIE